MLVRIAIAIVAGFLLGIFYASFLPVSLQFIAGALGLSTALMLVAQFLRQHSHMLFAVVIISAGVFGAIWFDVSRIQFAPELARLVDQPVLITGTVSSEPDVREGSVRLTVDVTNANGVPVDARALVIAPPFTGARYGDMVEVEGKLKLPERFESGEGRTFDYPMYLATRGITYQIPFARVRVTGHGGNPIKAAMIAIKSAYIGGLRTTLPEPYAGLAAGITAGDKRSVGSELSDVFQRVSLVHILVLSGYNITVVLGALMGPLSRFGRGTRLLTVLVVILFFAVISGGAASATRAGAMAFAAVFARLYGRQFLALRVLVAIVALMVLWNPYLLAFDPGFQLSVLATLGLILFTPHIERQLSIIPERLSLREIAAATISTQLTVLPLLLYSNGILSIVALPANLLALIAIPLAMLCSAIAACAGMILGTWGTIVALPAYVLLRYITLIAEFFAAVPFASVSISAFSAWWLVPAYGVLGIFVVLKRKRPGAVLPAERVIRR